MRSQMQLEEMTGYRSLYDALHGAKTSRDGGAILYCLEVVRPMVAGLVSEYMRLAAAKGISQLVSKEDLEQDAFEQIIKSIDRFDPPLEGADDDLVCLKAWNRYTSLVAKSPVREAYSRSMGPVRIPDWALKIASKLNKAIRDYENDKIDRYLSDDSTTLDLGSLNVCDIAARARLEYSLVKRFIDTGLHFLPGIRFSGIEQAELGEETPSVSGDPELYFTEDQEVLLQDGLQLLNSRQRFAIIRLYGLEGRPGTYQSIGKALRLDADEVKALERSALALLKEAFMEDDLS